jgi:hypothetical protein
VETFLMASAVYVPVSGESEECEVIDEIANTDSEGQDDGTEKNEIRPQDSELLSNSETHKEIQPSLENQVLSEHDISGGSFKQTRNMDEEVTTVHTEDANVTKAFPPEQVVGVEKSLEVKRNVIKIPDKLEIAVGQNEYENNEKESCNHQSSFVNTEKAENVDVKVAQSVAQTVIENSKKVDGKTISTEAKQDNESEKKIDVIKNKSLKKTVQACCTGGQPKRAVSSDFVLLVAGLYPRHFGVSGTISKACEHCVGSPICSRCPITS